MPDGSGIILFGTVWHDSHDNDLSGHLPAWSSRAAPPAIMDNRRGLQIAPLLLRLLPLHLDEENRLLHVCIVLIEICGRGALFLVLR